MTAKKLFSSFLLGCVCVAFSASCSSSEERVALGGEVFKQSCAQCHSLEPNAPPLAGPNLAFLFSVQEARNTLSNGRALNVQNLKVLITVGYGEMPGTALEPDELDALIEYLLATSKPEQP